LFSAGSFERLAIPLSLVARLEEFPASAIEHAGGSKVVQYRNRILSLVSLREVLEPGTSDNGRLSHPMQVVVFNDGDRSVGMIVDQIVDVAEEAVKVRQKSSRKGLLGSAVVGERVTDFLDLNAVISASRESWFQGQNGSDTSKSVLVVDDSSFSRGMIRCGLDMAGYLVLEVANSDQAIQILEKEPVNIVLAALGMPADGASLLLAAIRQRPEWKELPILALVDAADTVHTSAALNAGFHGCLTRSDQALLIESLARFVAPVTSIESAMTCVGWER
jgi:two-component system chemotaxis sensor kinase CheA